MRAALAIFAVTLAAAVADCAAPSATRDAEDTAAIREAAVAAGDTSVARPHALALRIASPRRCGWLVAVGAARDHCPSPRN
ncbi:MAG TPA: hypothetical protein VKT30_03335 [Caulobacteraceae bacterium]|nr:hypothetical protein [Caulobacteraceae bacterium]